MISIPTFFYRGYLKNYLKTPIVLTPFFEKSWVSWKRNFIEKGKSFCKKKNIFQKRYFFERGIFFNLKFNIDWLS